jgi:hypothetical protein
MKFAIYSRQLCIACVLAISITACTSGDNAEQDVLVSEILQMNLKAVRGDTRDSGVRSTDKTVSVRWSTVSSTIYLRLLSSVIVATKSNWSAKK